MADNLTKTGKAAREAMLEMAASLDDVQLSELYADLKTQSDELAGRLDALKEIELGRMLESGDEKRKIEGVGSWSMQQGRTTSYTDPKKLLEKGVEPDVIEYATVTRQGDPFVVFRAERSKDG